MGRAICSVKNLMLVALVATCFCQALCRNECLAGESDGAKEPTSDPRIQKLITRVKDGSPRIRRMAAQTLIKIGRPALEPVRAAQAEAEGVVRRTFDFVGMHLTQPPTTCRIFLYEGRLPPHGVGAGTTVLRRRGLPGVSVRTDCPKCI